MWKTWANLLTLLRLAAIGPCAWAIAEGHWLLAAGLFILAVITDLLDGPLARRFSHDSPVGGLFDHATDAAFVTIALLATAWVGFTSFLLPVLIIVAFVQYALDSRALAGQHLRTSWLGKNNGIAYFVLVGVVVIRNALGWTWPADAWIHYLDWLLIFTTLVSMTDRLIALLRERSTAQPR
jgi:phosphatidylglycerophosphate synthase